MRERSLFPRADRLHGLAVASHLVLLEVLEVNEHAIRGDAQRLGEVVGDCARVLEVLLLAEVPNGLDLKAK